VGFIFVALLMISLFYNGLDWSQKHLPESVHVFVLLIYLIGLGFCISLMATEATRKRQLDRILRIFGPNGLLFLPVLTLIVAAAVFASLTLTLYNHHWVALEPCAGRTVTAGTLTDFYTWHFFKLVPLVKFNETLKWGEPVCYSQSRVGFLILLFQALVVIPSINTIRFYWKNRG
jgi:hypothetical protein